jgi:hypothetical protein
MRVKIKNRYIGIYFCFTWCRFESACPTGFLMFFREQLAPMNQLKRKVKEILSMCVLISGHRKYAQ